MTSRDTSSVARATQRAAHRRLGPAGRVEQAMAMSELARTTSIQGILARNPELGPEQARAQLLRRLLGAELYEAAFPARP